MCMGVLGTSTLLCMSCSPRHERSRETVRQDNSGPPPLIPPFSVSKNSTCTQVHSDNQVQPYHSSTPSACTKDYYCPSCQATSSAGTTYQMLQDIHCTSFTNDNLRKAHAVGSTKSTSSREACGLHPKLRSRAFILMPHLLLYFDFCYLLPFLRATTYPKEITSLLMSYRPWDSRKFIKATHLRTCRYIAASYVASKLRDVPHSCSCTVHKCTLIIDQRPNSYTSIKHCCFSLIILVIGR